MPALAGGLNPHLYDGSFGCLLHEICWHKMRVSDERKDTQIYFLAKEFYLLFEKQNLDTAD